MAVLVGAVWAGPTFSAHFCTLEPALKKESLTGGFCPTAVMINSLFGNKAIKYLALMSLAGTALGVSKEPDLRRERSCSEKTSSKWLRELVLD